MRAKSLWFVKLRNNNLAVSGYVFNSREAARKWRRGIEALYAAPVKFVRA